jgi:hypothetical protein
MAHPRVLANKEGHFAVFEVAADGGAEHRAVDPDFAALLLGYRRRAIAPAKRSKHGPAIGPTQVVPLTAAAVIEDAFATVDISDGAQPLGHLSGRRIPVDLFERAICAPAQRVQYPLATAVLVIKSSGSHV